MAVNSAAFRRYSAGSCMGASSGVFRTSLGQTPIPSDYSEIVLDCGSGTKHRPARYGPFPQWGKNYLLPFPDDYTPPKEEAAK